MMGAAQAGATPPPNGGFDLSHTGAGKIVKATAARGNCWMTSSI
jgi:hypothetical protein